MCSVDYGLPETKLNWNAHGKNCYYGPPQSGILSNDLINKRDGNFSGISVSVFV